MDQKIMKIEVRYYATAMQAAVARTEFIALPPGSTLRDLMLILATKHGGNLRSYMFDASGNPTGYLTYLVKGSDIRSFEGFDTKLADGDAVTVFPKVNAFT